MFCGGGTGVRKCRGLGPMTDGLWQTAMISVRHRHSAANLGSKTKEDQAEPFSRDAHRPPAIRWRRIRRAHGQEDQDGGERRAEEEDEGQRGSTIIRSEQKAQLSPAKGEPFGVPLPLGEWGDQCARNHPSGGAKAFGVVSTSLFSLEWALLWLCLSDMLFFLQRNTPKKSDMIFAVVSVLVLCAAAAANGRAYTVFSDRSGLRLYPDIVDPEGIAYGHYEDTLNTTGFGTLVIKTNRRFSDASQMRAAGFLEGAVTAPRIVQHRNNLWAWYKGHYLPAGGFPPRLVEWMSQNLQYAREQVQERAGDPYWEQVGLVLSQLDSLVLGFKSAA